MDPKSTEFHNNPNNQENNQQETQADIPNAQILANMADKFDSDTAKENVANAMENIHETADNTTPEQQEKEKQLDPRVESLAIPLARDYAEKNYAKLPDGTFEPAWRGVNGEKDYKGKSPEDLMAAGMPEDQARAAVIDIANQPYNEYSEYWKEQNRGGAEFLVNLLDQEGDATMKSLDLNDATTRAKYGDLIHNNWLERNEWVKDPNYGDPNLAKPFAELPPEEQQKDIDQLGVLQNWLEKQKNNNSNSEEKPEQDLTSGKREIGQDEFWTLAKGNTLDDAYDMLQREKDAYYKFNGHIITSDMTKDEVYQAVLGETVAEREKSKAEWRQAYEERERKEKAEAQEKIPVWTEAGKQLIYPELHDDWEECVKIRANDIYHGRELEDALQIMQMLDRGASMEEIKKVEDEQGHSGVSYGMMSSIIFNFSKRGPEHAIANLSERFSLPKPEELENIAQTMRRNERLEEQNSSDYYNPAAYK